MMNSDKPQTQQQPRKGKDGKSKGSKQKKNKSRKDKKQVLSTPLDLNAPTFVPTIPIPPVTVTIDPIAAAKQFNVDA